jgi:hypothetical protein
MSAARLFTAGSSELGENTATPSVTAAPLTFFCWVWPTSVGIDLALRSTNVVRAAIVSGGTATNVDTTATASAGSWQSLAFVEAAANDHRVYYNGANKVTSSTSRTPGGTINRTRVGNRTTGGSLSNQYFDGRIAWATIWNVALHDNEISALHAGINPLWMRQQRIVGCYRL